MLRALLLIHRWIAIAHDRWRAQVARRHPLSARIDELEERVRRLQQENELLRARLRRVPLPPRSAPEAEGVSLSPTLTFRRDLAAAGIPRRDDEERVVDFHALRTIFVSWLAAAGVHPRTAQALARHASVETTMQRYTDLRLLDLKATVDRLPLPSSPPSKGEGGELRTWDRRGAARPAQRGAS